MFNKHSFKVYKQHDSFDCGPTCLRMICEHYGKKYPLQFLRDISFISKEGVSLYTISKAAERVGFKTLRLKLTADYLVENLPLPCILHWNNDHFVVLYKIRHLTGRKQFVKFYIADPSIGDVVLDYKTFVKCWGLSGEPDKGFALAMEPTEEFNFLHTSELNERKKLVGYRFLYKYFKKHNKSFFQLCLGMVMGSALSFLLPFLTQSMVDNGIGSKNLNFVFLILIFQLFVFLGSTVIDFIRTFLILHIGNNVNISIISDFLTKLMKLTVGFFDSKLTGDILQRIDDHKRIETFLTSSILDTFFSVFNLLILSAVLGIFGIKFLLIFLIMSTVTFIWSLMFMKKIKIADYKMFSFFSRNRDNLYEIINGMPEIKLNNFELYQRWKWETNQLKLFSITSYVAKLRQYQKLGTVFFTQLKNIIITYFAVVAVVNGDITFGVMLSISYLIGQLNSPIDQIITFFDSAQSARISLERMMEIHEKQNEEKDDIDKQDPSKITENNQCFENDAKEEISFHDVSFQYEDEKSPFVLKNLNLEIPIGKVTAIVGTSGSGKTTLLKLLLKFYPVTSGKILVKGMNLNDLSSNEWRTDCGVVMQEGYMFSDTIRRNIVMGDETLDNERLINACKIANILDFINSLPLKFNTKLGGAGINISTGQKQRILIARAVYKDPSFLIFDEATSALDANNEKIIVENLSEVFKGKTVVVIAHRLSTVKNADQIIVLDKGQIQEVGHHTDLVSLKGEYFHLVKNQLELGN